MEEREVTVGHKDIGSCDCAFKYVHFICEGINCWLIDRKSFPPVEYFLLALKYLHCTVIPVSITVKRVAILR